MHEAQDHMLCLKHKQLTNRAAEELEEYIEPHQQQPALLLHQQPSRQRAHAHMEASGRQVRAMSRREGQPDSGRNQDRSNTLTVDLGHLDDRQHQHEEQHVVNTSHMSPSQTNRQESRQNG